MTSPLILASESSYRRALLPRLGLAFEALAADLDEARAPGEPPQAMAQRLAREKARAVSRLRPDAFVIGSDQVIALDGEIFSKPGTREGAIAQLQRLAGRTHDLLTAVAVLTPTGDVHEALVTYKMHMRALSEAEITTYVNEDLPLDCAGSYKIEAAGIRLFRSLEGDDYTAIIGLPLTRVWTLLQDAGFFATP